MAQQLIFTSAVAGLNPGSSGYCTVARSESMREAVAVRLEQWSVYAHAARGPRPVVCAHRILNLRGSSFHVLTRIVDSGLDYTGRTNFLAHHLVLQPHEIHGACSPAEVFSNWKGWLTEWEGAPRYLDETSFSLHAVPRTTRMPASAWAEAAGDAGAAALLLSNGAGQAVAKSVDLIVPASFEKGLLRLYAESLYLADPEGENAPIVWAVPFTTFLQVENDPADFRWRGLWPEDRGRATGGVLCDFVNGHIPPIVAGLLADYARTGNPKTAARPNVAPGHLTPVVMGRPTTALNLPIASAAGIRWTSRRPAGAGSASNPSTLSASHGMPKWVWITLLFVIPAGVVAGWFFGRQKDVDITSKRRPNVQNRPSETAAATPQIPPRSKVSSESLPLLVNEGTPDPAELQRKQQLSTILAELDAGTTVEDPHSALNASRTQELAKLKTLLSSGTSTDLQVSDLHKEVTDINHATTISNSDYENHQALETLPHGLVYVVIAAGRKAEILDSKSPLKAWMEGISNDSANLNAYNIFIRHSSIVEPNQKQIHLERDNESGSGNLVSESLQYTISPTSIESAEGWDSRASSWIYFAPIATTALPVFNILVARSSPMFSISSSACIEWQSDPAGVRFRPGIEQLLTEQFKQWKNSNGDPLDVCLEVQLKGELQPLPAQNGLVFIFSSRIQRQKALDAAVEDLRAAEQNAESAEQQGRNIEASQEFFAKLQLSPETLKALNGPTGLAAGMTGDLIYNRIGGWVYKICDDNATAEFVMPTICAPDQRLAYIERAISRLNDLASQKSHLAKSKELRALAADLSRIQWSEHVALLSDTKNENVAQRLTAKCKQAQEAKEKAQAALDQSPDLTRIDKLWICCRPDPTNSSSVTRLIEVAKKSLTESGTAMSLKY